MRYMNNFLIMFIVYSPPSKIEASRGSSFFTDGYISSTQKTQKIVVKCLECMYIWDNLIFLKIGRIHADIFIVLIF